MELWPFEIIFTAFFSQGALAKNILSKTDVFRYLIGRFSLFFAQFPSWRLALTALRTKKMKKKYFKKKIFRSRAVYIPTNLPCGAQKNPTR
jgi:hypothetical protein